MIDTCVYGFEELSIDEMQVSGGECPSVMPTWEEQSDSSLETDNSQDEIQLSFFRPNPWWGPSRFARRPRWFFGVWF